MSGVLNHRFAASTSMGIGPGAMGGAGITGMMFRWTTGGGRNLLDPSEPLRMPVKFEAVVVKVVLGAWNASLAARVKATTLAAVYCCDNC